MYLKLSSSLLPPGRLPGILESGWDETGCESVPSMSAKNQAFLLKINKNNIH